MNSEKKSIFTTNSLNTYLPFEEKINVITHAFGLMLSILALILLIIKASVYGNVWHIVSFSIFGVCLITLYTASTLYHNAKKVLTRNRLNVFDHASIYVLIAGTYTPFTLITLHGTLGWVIFGIVWSMAIAGVILKFYFIGKYEILSTVMYVIMGWIIVLVLKPLIHNLSIEGIIWLFSGGIFYTIGSVFFSIKKIKLNHAIFHIFVLLGSFCHFISIYFYIIK